MILTKEEILKEMKRGNIGIIPFDEKSLGPASYDLTLDSRVWVFKEKINVTDLEEIANNPKVLYEKYLEEIDISKNPYLLKPGELILGITKEKIKLSESICGFIMGRSRFARVGLMVHVSASFIQPGVFNRQVFEIYNASDKIIKIKPNIKIAQIIFAKCLGKSKYNGVWKDQ